MVFTDYKIISDFNYTDLINIANNQKDPIERMKYVVTFLVFY